MFNRKVKGVALIVFMPIMISAFLLVGIATADPVAVSISIMDQVVEIEDETGIATTGILSASVSYVPDGQISGSGKLQRAGSTYSLDFNGGEMEIGDDGLPTDIAATGYSYGDTDLVESPLFRFELKIPIDHVDDAGSRGITSKIKIWDWGKVVEE